MAKSKAVSKIWIVFGETGEYDSHHEWSIAAYKTEELAQAHADAATKFYQDNNCLTDRYKWSYSRLDEFKNPFDPNMDIDYTGTSWGVYPVELRSALPKES